MKWVKSQALIILQTSMGGGFNITWSELMNMYVFERDALSELWSELMPKKKGD